VNDLSNTILLVDDNEDDVYALKRALKKAGIANPIRVVTDGQQALDYLTGVGEYAKREQHPIPFIVFLDLKLPYFDGFEVLTRMRQEPALNSVIVVILTGSDETKDHQRAYALGARSYLVKPPTASDVLQLMESMQSYWTRDRETGPIENRRP
jgi:CheY-like chemotaxis protein